MKNGYCWEQPFGESWVLTVAVFCTRHVLRERVHSFVTLCRRLFRHDSQTAAPQRRWTVALQWLRGTDGAIVLGIPVSHSAG